MSTATVKTDNGSAVPAVQSKGTTSANNHESSEEINFCAHRNHGCISQQGYRCTNGPVCNPCDSNGRRFVIFEWIENGQRLATRHYLDDANGIPLRSGNKAVCGRVIDVDTVQRKTPLDAKARMTHEAITAIQRAHGIVARH